MKNADVVLIMEHGKVVAAGNHKTLMQSNELYSSLVQRQMTAFDDTPNATPAPEDGAEPITVTVAQ